MAEKISIIQNIFKDASLDSLPSLIEIYRSDERAGVQKLIESAGKKLTAHALELQRVEQMLTFERRYGAEGVVCGIDEAGRGPLAGPVVAAAVILDRNHPILYVNDSKKLSEKKREQLFDEIMTHAISVGVGIADPETIDRVNILQADYIAMRDAISQLSPKPDAFLNDAVTIPEVDGHQIPIIKGDAKSLSIAAASIIAKVTRDRMMRDYDQLFPEYEFAKNKGYGTAEHIAALKLCGASPIHRKSFIGHFVPV